MSRRRNCRKFYTLEEAAKIGDPCVYGLYDDGNLFYIGQTNRPDIRFGYDYTYNRTYIRNPFLSRRLNEAGDRLRVSVLDRRPHDLIKAEKRQIQKYMYVLQLANIIHNPMIKYKCRICEAPTKPGYPLCGQCAMRHSKQSAA